MTLSDPIWISGGLVGLLTTLAVPLWRTWLAQQRRAAQLADGESSWIKRQAGDLDNARKVIDQLLQLRAADAELIASLRLDKALSEEREQRLMARLQKLEDIVVEIKPEYAQWIRSDFGPGLKPKGKP
jgi:hypothetical protein